MASFFRMFDSNKQAFVPMTKNLLPEKTIPMSILSLDEDQARLYGERDALYDDMHFKRIPPQLLRKTTDRLAEIESRITSQQALIAHLLVEHHDNTLDQVKTLKSEGVKVTIPEPESRFDKRVLQAVRRAARHKRRAAREEARDEAAVRHLMFDDIFD